MALNVIPRRRNPKHGYEAVEEELRGDQVPQGQPHRSGGRNIALGIVHFQRGVGVGAVKIPACPRDVVGAAGARVVLGVKKAPCGLEIFLEEISASLDIDQLIFQDAKTPDVSPREKGRSRTSSMTHGSHFKSTRCSTISIKVSTPSANLSCVTLLVASF